jgi:hypothetical protein
VHLHVHIGESGIGTLGDKSSPAASGVKPPKPAMGLDEEVLGVLGTGPQKKEAIIRMTSQGKGPSHGRAVTRSLERLWSEKRVVNVRHGWWRLAE